jgi:hypothetical protein
MGNILSFFFFFMNDTYNNLLFDLLDMRFKVVPNPPKIGLLGSP